MPDGAEAAMAARQRSPASIAPRGRDVEEPAARNQLPQQVEAEAVPARERLARIVDSADDAILATDLEGRITAWNRGAQKIFGYAPQGVIGQRADLLAPADRKHEAAAAIARIVHGERVVRYDTVRLTERGRPVEVSVAVSPLHNGHGQLVGVSTIIRDVTSYRETARQLVDRDAQFRSLLDQSVAGIFIVSDTAEVIYVNAGFTQIFGYDPTECLGHSFLEFTEPSCRDTLLERLRANLSGDCRQVEVRLRTRSGTWRDVLSHASPVQYEGRRAVIGVVVDITERKDAERALERANRFLRTISACNETLVRARHEGELLDGMCASIVGVGQYRASAIVLHEANGTTRVAASTGVSLDTVLALEAFWSSAGDGLPLASVQVNAGEPVADEGRGAAAVLVEPAAIFLPLMNGSKVLGTLGIDPGDGTCFDVDELALLRELADDLSYGITTLRRRLEHDAFTERLRGAMEATVAALAATAEMRDPYTAGHQQRVAALAAAIACEMGLDDARVQAVHFASVVHDIGKIKIPSELLSKPGRLTKVEAELVQTHVEAGYEILRGVDFPWPIADIVRLHHERLDGSGYPHGLTAPAISVEGRIVAVADVVEAMSAHRPYRPARGIDVALHHIEAERGTLYDADVVDACIALFRTGRFAFSQP